MKLGVMLCFHSHICTRACMIVSSLHRWHYLNKMCLSKRGLRWSAPVPVWRKNDLWYHIVSYE